MYVVHVNILFWWRIYLCIYSTKVVHSCISNLQYFKDLKNEKVTSFGCVTKCHSYNLDMSFV